MIICGVTNNEMREKLLQNDEQTLEQAIELCKVIEKSKEQSKEMEHQKATSTGFVDAVKTNQSTTGVAQQYRHNKFNKYKNNSGFFPGHQFCSWLEAYAEHKFSSGAQVFSWLKIFSGVQSLLLASSLLPGHKFPPRNKSFPDDTYLFLRSSPKDIHLFRLLLCHRAYTNLSESS